MLTDVKINHSASSKPLGGEKSFILTVTQSKCVTVQGSTNWSGRIFWVENIQRILKKTGCKKLWSNVKNKNYILIPCYSQRLFLLLMKNGIQHTMVLWNITFLNPSHILKAGKLFYLYLDITSMYQVPIKCWALWIEQEAPTQDNHCTAGRNNSTEWQVLWKGMF